MPRPSPWVSTAAACDGLSISQWHLRRLRQDGLLVEGKHFRNIARPQAARPTYQWHLANIEALLAKPQSKR